MVNSRLSFARNLVVTENTRLRSSQPRKARERCALLMKTVMKKTKKILINLLSTLILVLISFYVYLNNSIDSVMTKETQKNLFSKIKKTEDLPNSFYIQYEKLNPNGLSRNYTQSLISRFTNNRKTCACEEIYANPSLFYNYTQFAPHIFFYEINEKIGAKKCLDYELRNKVFANGIVGVTEASQRFYNKEIKDLKDDEILDLLIINENPSYYNPLRRKENLTKRRKQILSK